jgi:hypothetical protein
MKGFGFGASRMAMAIGAALLAAGTDAARCRAPSCARLRPAALTRQGLSLHSPAQPLAELGRRRQLRARASDRAAAALPPPRGLMFALPVKQEVETYNSRHLDGTLMYPGRWICTYVLMWKLGVGAGRKGAGVMPTSLCIPGTRHLLAPVAVLERLIAARCQHGHPSWHWWKIITAQLVVATAKSRKSDGSIDGAEPSNRSGPRNPAPVSASRTAKSSP